MRGLTVLFVMMAAGCGGLVDEAQTGDEAGLDRCAQADVKNPPVCVAPKKYALLFEGRPKPTGFSNDQSGEDANDMDANIANLEKALEARKYEVTKVDDFGSFDAEVTRLAKKVRCCDEVLVYYTGHGSHKKGDRRKDFGYLDPAGEMHFLVTNADAPAPGRVPQAKNVDARQLALMLSKLKTCHLHVVIDACYAGGFVDALLSTLPGLESIQTSANASEPAWSGAIDQAQAKNDDGTFETPPRMVQDPYGRAQGETGSEFSSGFTQGLKGAPAGASAEQLVQAGFTGALARDVTAIAKWTHPVNQHRNGGCTCLPGGDPWIPMCAPQPPSETVPSPSPRG